jgi:DNA adenine methylase
MQSISPLRYPGGKSRVVKTFEKYLPKDVTSICSPFLGGGSFELHCITNFGINVHAYDLFEPLTIFWNCLLDDPERLAAIVSNYLPLVTKECFYRLQHTFIEIGPVGEGRCFFRFKSNLLFRIHSVGRNVAAG